MTGKCKIDVPTQDRGLTSRIPALSGRFLQPLLNLSQADSTAVLSMFPSSSPLKPKATVNMDSSRLSQLPPSEKLGQECGQLTSGYTPEENTLPSKH